MPIQIHVPTGVTTAPISATSHVTELLVGQDSIEFYEVATISDPSAVTTLGVPVETISPDSVDLPVVIEGCVQRELQGDGFHRTVVTTVEVARPSDLAGECAVRLAETVPETTFVDVYQLAEGVKFGGPGVSPATPIDLEKPSSSSVQHRITLTSQPGAASGNGKQLKAVHPVHLRYQNPAKASGSGPASGSARHLRRTSQLPKPRASIKCSGWDHHAGSTGHAHTTPIAGLLPPSSSSSPFLLRQQQHSGDGWRHLIGSGSSCPDGEVSFSVPVGNQDAFDMVTWVTLIITLLGALFVIYSALRKGFSGAGRSKDKSP